MPTPVPKKKAKPTQSKLRKILDALFSKYIRNYYAVNGMVQCYTCPNRKPVKEMQNGHFMSRLYLGTRFDPRNCRPQCVGCNMYGGGKPAEFGTKLEAETPGIVHELMAKARKPYPDYPYAQEIAHYKAILAKNDWL